MITFCIYTSSKLEGMKYSEIVERFLFTKDDQYKIVLFNNHSNNIIEEINDISDSKIFLLDIDVNIPFGGLEIAKNIRHNGDFTSPIILLTEDRKKISIGKLKNVLYLDILNKSYPDKALLSVLHVAYKIVTRYSILSFSIFDELYRLPYDQICFIEKNRYNDTVTIHTIDDTYQNYISIKSLEVKLMKDPRFYKSHRSCIINVYNVISFDKKSNTVIFKNGLTTNLVARHKKRLLVDRLNEIDGELYVKE